jgi:hypothetical protein
MVNELLREAPAEAKEDFKNGVVYIDPDDKLRAIYMSYNVAAILHGDE